jgi:MFS-type transporter involved in bile tolerance (Atg22 family)
MLGEINMNNESIILIAGTSIVALSIWKKPMQELTLLLIMFLVLAYIGLYLVVAKDLDAALTTKYWSIIGVLFGAFVGRISGSSRNPEESKNPKKEDNKNTKT